MGNAAAHWASSQAPEDRVLRPPNMQNNGQTKLRRKSQLRLKETLLADTIKSRYEMIKPDLADRHQSGVVAMTPERVSQPLEIRVLGAIDKKGMNPECVGPTRHSLREQPDRLEVADLNRRNDDAINALTLGRQDDRIPVWVKFSRVEMAVGVD